jgi:hypothetical protein
MIASVELESYSNNRFGTAAHSRSAHSVIFSTSNWGFHWHGGYEAHTKNITDDTPICIADPAFPVILQNYPPIIPAFFLSSGVLALSVSPLC